MNLFDLQKNFWRLDEQESFSGNETRLYFYLLYLANRSYWSEWIEYGDKKMVANVNISLQVLKSAREKLRNTQLISFVSFFTSNIAFLSLMLQRNISDVQPFYIAKLFIVFLQK